MFMLALAEAKCVSEVRQARNSRPAWKQIETLLFEARHGVWAGRAGEGTTQRGVPITAS